MGIENMGTLQQLRSLFVPQIPPALEHGKVQLLRGDITSAAHSSDEAEIRTSFNFTYDHPLVEFVSQNLVNGEIEGNICRAVTRVGVVFGMEAESPGAHNVIAGIFDALKAHNNNSILFGFVGGIDGLCSQNKLVVTDDLLKGYRNQGGCDLLGQSSKKIHEFQQMEDARSSCITLKLDGLVFVGGCSANTDAARLAEYFKSTKCQTTVVGVPVTLEGDLKNEFVETDVGFDTVCKVSSQLIGNICLDALSAGKYYFFVRLVGKGASHVALECSLQSNPNLVILGEEVATSNMTLSQVTNCICDAIQARAEKGKYHGVIILSEGLIENIVDIRLLIQEIKGLLKEGISTKKCPSLLSPSSAALLKSLPLFIQKQLLEEMETEGLNYLSNVRFHILSQHKLQHLGNNKDTSLLHLNFEQLSKCLKSLLDLYHVTRKSESNFENQAEFYCYYVLMNLGSHKLWQGETLAAWFRSIRPSLWKSKKMEFARNVLRCYRMGNFKGFFNLVRDSTYLEACLMEYYFNEVRAQAVSCINYSGYKLSPFPLVDIAELLLMTEFDMEDFCSLCGLATSTDEKGHKFLPVKQVNFNLPAKGFPQCRCPFIEGKLASSNSLEITRTLSQQ